MDKEIKIGDKIRYIGDSYKVSVMKGNVYVLLDIDPDFGWFKVLDEMEDKAFFPAEEFELVS